MKAEDEIHEWWKTYIESADEDEFIRRCLPLDLDHDLEEIANKTDESKEDSTKSFTARKAGLKLITRLALYHMILMHLNDRQYYYIGSPSCFL